MRLILISIPLVYIGAASVMPIVPPTGPDVPRLRRATAESKAIIRDQPSLDKFLSAMGELKRGQFGTDFVHTPDESVWHLKKETIPRSVLEPGATGDVKIVLDKLLYRAGPTAVYTIADHPDLVIKYYAYCVDKYEPHDAIVVEAYFMIRLQSVNIAPKFYFYSGYIDSVPPTESKLIESTCPAHSPKPHIRYMIMERLGLSWKDYMNKMPRKKIGFVRAIKIGAKVIMLLQKLHAENIVHGDAHMGNFVFRGQDEFKELAVIDFGRSRIVSDDEQATFKTTSDSFCSRKSTLHPWLGKWEMNGCTPSFHDDVYRVVQCAAMSIHGMVHFNYLDSLIETNPEEYKRIKNEADFWELPGMSLNGIIRKRKLAGVKRVLGEVSKLASTMDPSDPHKKPPYEAILGKYRQIMHLVTGAKFDADNIFEL